MLRKGLMGTDEPALPAAISTPSNGLNQIDFSSHASQHQPLGEVEFMGCPSHDT